MFLTSNVYLWISPVNQLSALSDDCRYLVLLAKIQNKVGKNEEGLFSLQKVSGSSCLAHLFFFYIFYQVFSNIISFKHFYQFAQI